MSKYERMIASDGSLTLYEPGSLSPVLTRQDYAKPYRNINTSHEFASTLRAGPYDWPRGYDGAILCSDCARKHASLIMRSIHERDKTEWHITGMFLAGHDTDSFLSCDNCSKVIQDEWQTEDEEED